MHILINDFIGGALDRGIPLYVRNLIDGLRNEGLRVSTVRAPAFCRKLPRGALYMIAVLVEQILLPLIGFWLRADLTIYPYNSVAVIDLLTRRGRIVVHDLEQLNRPLSFSKLYYLACYRALKWRNAPLFTISEISRVRIVDSGLFGDGLITLLPNTFYAFERLAGVETPTLAKSILLCTGSTANKDLATVVGEYLPPVLAKGQSVAILGLHKPSDMATLQPLAEFIRSGQVRLCGRLSDAEVARAYRAHAVVWVHSLREGFGRCVVEGRLAGARVLASDIPEFAELRDGDVYLYKNPASFLAGLDRLTHMDAQATPYTGYPYRELLRKAIDGAMRAKQAPGATQAPQAI